ncbi:hypothetical protein AQUCO_08300024v1 [Aquilegia coerulea]|uniref:Basic secretory protease n=1 Tax=Aquilegia coerulea TaxID=218851 RepID=A0A2G5C702_AQUCA|nr:hypothetical protein AQUCO_08300024v1 [Aquilegia coerulea]
MIFLSSLLFLSTLQSFQAVEYNVVNNEPNSPGGMKFTNEIGVDYFRQQLEAASAFAWQTFRQTTAADRKNIQRVTVFIEDTVARANLDVPAYAVGSELHFNTRYIAQYSGDVKRELTGVLYHEATHIWQWNGNGAPNIGGLIEGIADYVRLKANLAPSHWVQPGVGSPWNRGYDVTARFLDYCNSLKEGFVAELNGKMRNGYSDNFFSEILGKSVDQLFSEYKARYGNRP